MQRRRYKRAEKKVKRGALSSLLDLILVPITIICGLCLLLTLAAPNIDPSIWFVLPLLALVAPVVYVVNLLLALYWITRWRLMISMPLLLLLIIGGSYSTLFIKIPLTKSYQDDNYRGSIKIITYNVRQFTNDSGERVGKEVGRYLEKEMADIVCLQECSDQNSGNGINESNTPRLASFHSAHHNGNSLYSRYPIVASGDFSNAENRLDKGTSMWADLAIGRDTIRLFNNHLKSTTIKAKDSRYLTSTQIVRDTNRRETLRNILLRYVESCRLRAEEAKQLSRFIDASPYRVVVCGDFNDTPASFAYTTVARVLQDTFRECGEGYSYTFRGFLNSLRIDYILCGEGITPMSYRVDRDVLYSDHLPVISHVKLIR